MIDKYLQYLQYEKNSSPHTVLSYRTDLLQFCSFLQTSPDNFNPSDVTRQDIQQWTLALLSDNISARSLSRKISTLRSFLEVFTNKISCRKKSNVKNCFAKD